MKRIELVVLLSIAVSFVLNLTVIWLVIKEYRLRKLRKKLGIIEGGGLWEAIDGAIQRLRRRDSKILEQRIIQAGTPWGITPARFVVAKLLWFLLGLLYSWQEGYEVWMMVLLAVLAFFLPDILLMYKTRQRVNKFKNELPEAIDTIEIAVAADVPMDEVFLLAADTVDERELKKELLALSARYFVTRDKEKSLKEFIQGVPLSETKVLAMAMLQGEKTGRMKEIIGSLSTGLFNSALAKVSRDEKSIQYKILMAIAALAFALLTLYFQAYFTSLDQGLRIIF